MDPYLKPVVQNNQEQNLPSPDFTKISERPQTSKFKKGLFLALKIIGLLIVLVLVLGLALGAVYYNNIKQAYSLSFSAKADLEESVHKIINRDFTGAAELIKNSNTKFSQAQTFLNQVALMRHVPYLGLQLKAVDNVLIAALNLTDSGEKVVLLIDDITKPLKNESITYASLSVEQKRQILEKIVASEDMLKDVQKKIDLADNAISAVPSEDLVAPLRDGIAPIQLYLPKLKMLIDTALPMLNIIPKVAGFDAPKSYLFLLQNNSELRPTGGFIGTYGILQLQDGDIKEFATDNIYNLDRSTQKLVAEPSPWPIVKYLEQKDWSLRDINWAPDFPTTALKAIDMYDKENKKWLELKKTGQKILGEKGIEITDVLPYQQNLYGVIAVTPEILGELLTLTGPIVTDNMLFTAENYQDQLELMVGRLYQELDIPVSERKEIIRKLADQIKFKLTTLPLQQMPDILDLAFKAMDQKQIQIFLQDQDLQKLVLDRGWGGAIAQTDDDYLMVVDSNLASLKTDQFVKRIISYSLVQKGNDLVGKVEITYHNNADFTWKSTRLRSYTRVYVPLGSELISSTGAMENDKIKDPQLQPGQVESSEEFGKTYFGAFISIEPHETGVLSFEYKLPEGLKNKIILNNAYSLIVQKQSGVIPDLTLNLKFGKNIKSAVPAEPESEWFNSTYSNNLALDSDKNINVSFK